MMGQSKALSMRYYGIIVGGTVVSKSDLRKAGK